MYCPCFQPFLLFFMILSCAKRFKIHQRNMSTHNTLIKLSKQCCPFHRIDFICFFHIYCLFLDENGNVVNRILIKSPYNMYTPSWKSIFFASYVLHYNFYTLCSWQKTLKFSRQKLTRPKKSWWEKLERKIGLSKP